MSCLFVRAVAECTVGTRAHSNRSHFRALISLGDAMVSGGTDLRLEDPTLDNEFQETCAV